MFYWLEKAQKSVEVVFANCIIQELSGIVEVLLLFSTLAAFFMMFCQIGR